MSYVCCVFFRGSVWGEGNSTSGLCLCGRFRLLVAFNTRFSVFSFSSVMEIFKRGSGDVLLYIPVFFMRTSYLQLLFCFGVLDLDGDGRFVLFVCLDWAEFLLPGLCLYILSV